MRLYGPNKIEVDVKSYWVLFIEEVINPFYFFQVFSIILWLADDYVSYAVCVIILTFFSSITSLIQTRKVSTYYNIHLVCVTCIKSSYKLVVSKKFF